MKDETREWWEAIAVGALALICSAIVLTGLIIGVAFASK